MKKSLFPSLFLAFALHSAANPIRVLYVGAPDRAPRMAAYVLMRDLGRDAIWFDYIFKTDRNNQNIFKTDRNNQKICLFY
jgi:hypothetical protein